MKCTSCPPSGTSSSDLVCEEAIETILGLGSESHKEFFLHNSPCADSRSLILSGSGLADSSSDSLLMFRAAKEMIEKRFGRIWNPTGAKKMPTLVGSR